MVQKSAAMRQLLAKGLSIKARTRAARYRQPMRIRAAMAATRFFVITEMLLS